MLENYPLKQAPQGYVPNCETEHDADGNMRQAFKGGRVTLVCSKHNGNAEARVNGRLIGRWNDITIQQWGNILYTLETDFKYEIN